MIVRPATPFDVMDIYKMAVAFHEESSWEATKPDLRAIMAAVLNFTVQPGHMFYVAENDNGGLVGFLAASPTALIWSQDRHLTIHAIYVTPKARGGAAALMLEHAAVEEAMRIGAKEIGGAFSSGIDGANGDKFFQHAGYKAVGTEYSKRIEMEVRK